MDILAHGVYSIALNKTADRKVTTKREILTAFLWGIMPDVVAMGPSFLVALSIGSLDHHALWNEYDISGMLYPLTHSLVIFLTIFLAIFLITRKWYLPMLGWGLHILFDIPFHTQAFYPTPFLFPISSYTFPFGFLWRTPEVWISLWIGGIVWLAWAFYKKRKVIENVSAS